MKEQLRRVSLSIIKACRCWTCEVFIDTFSFPPFIHSFSSPQGRRKRANIVTLLIIIISSIPTHRCTHLIGKSNKNHGIVGLREIQTHSSVARQTNNENDFLSMTCFFKVTGLVQLVIVSSLSVFVLFFSRCWQISVETTYANRIHLPLNSSIVMIRGLLHRSHSRLLIVVVL